LISSSSAPNLSAVTFLGVAAAAEQGTAADMVAANQPGRL
jgi:hypothetical protein